MDIEALRARLSAEEGRFTKMYRDSRGIPTIGVGFNLSRPDAIGKLHRLGYAMDAVLRGEEISEAAVDALLDQTIAEAWEIATDLISDLVRHPEPVQQVVTDMAFNMGEPTLSKFKKMLAAVRNRCYWTAADEMLDSEWAKQVKGRAHALANLMRGAAAVEER